MHPFIGAIKAIVNLDRHSTLEKEHLKEITKTPKLPSFFLRISEKPICISINFLIPSLVLDSLVTIPLLVSLHPFAKNWCLFSHFQFYFSIIFYSTFKLHDPLSVKVQLQLSVSKWACSVWQDQTLSVVPSGSLCCTYTITFSNLLCVQAPG